jgi:hypothetical protein
LFNIPLGRDRVRLYATYLFVIVVALILAHMDNQADFLVFRKAASMDLAGRNPYPTIGSASVYSGSSFVYPYLISWLFVPFAALPVWLAEELFVVVSIVAYLIGLRLIGVKSNFLVISLVLSSVSIISFQMGTLNPILFLAIAATWKFRDKPIVSGLFVAIAVSTKLFLFPLVLFLVFSKRFRAFAAASALGGGVLGLGFLLGPLSAGGYYHLLTQLARHEGGQGYSLAALLDRLAVGATPAMMLAIVSSAVIFFLALTITEPKRRQQGIFLVAVVSSLIITPIMWASYLPLLIPAIATQELRRNWLVFLGPASWVLVTPDRLGAFGDAIGLVVVSTSSLLYWRQIRSEDKTSTTDYPQNPSQASTRGRTASLRTTISYSLAISYLALAAILLFDQINLAPAVVVQITLVLLCLLTLAPSQRYPDSCLVSSGP